MARPSLLHPVSSSFAADRRIAFSSASSVFSRYLLFDLTEHTVLGAEGSLRLGIDVGLVVEFYWPVKSFARDDPCSDRNIENNELGRDAGKREGVAGNRLREKCLGRLVKKISTKPVMRLQAEEKYNAVGNGGTR